VQSRVENGGKVADGVNKQRMRGDLVGSNDKLAQELV